MGNVCVREKSMMDMNPSRPDLAGDPLFPTNRQLLRVSSLLFPEALAVLSRLPLSPILLYTYTLHDIPFTDVFHLNGI
jgi:hypothetical protein